MKRKLIGTAEVSNGKAEYLWQIGEGTIPGKRKIHITYVEDDGYIGGEAYEDAYIRTPTNIIMGEENVTVNPTVDISNPSTVTLTANINTISSSGRIPEGNVQFQVKTENDEGFVNVGSPVQVINGTASYDYEIPQTPQTTILAKALFLPNTLYGGCETEVTETIRVRGRVAIEVGDITTNPGVTEMITATVTNINGGEVGTGQVKFFLDDTEISEIPILNTTELRFRYPIPDEIQSGRHELKVVYVENEQFMECVAIAHVDIRTIVIIEATEVYAPQTITENNVIKAQGVAHIPINIRTIGGLAVTEGTIIFEANGETIEKEIDISEDNPTIDYNIPKECTGGQEIPYTLTYVENTNYKGAEGGSSIHIKFRTILTFDTVECENDGEIVSVAFAGNLGDKVTLTALLEDENGEPINEGEVTFELEQLDETPDGDIGGQEEETIVDDDI